MDLVIAVQHLAAVVNVRQTHAARGVSEADAPTPAGRAGIIAGAGVGLERAADTIPEINAVARRDAIPEVDQVWVRPAARVQLGQLGIIQHPDTDAIAIRNSARLAIPIQ